MAEEEEDDDVFTIMVATDSHLGYCDRDAVRGTDSFAAFEEVLRLANDRGADFLLLAGDLFHDNKPSRRTLFKTMSLLRRYALSDAAVGFEVRRPGGELPAERELRGPARVRGPAHF